MNWYVPPLPTGFEEKAPVSDTIVWDAVSLFVQVMVVPLFTVIVSGLNAKFSMVTELPTATGDGATVPVMAVSWRAALEVATGAGEVATGVAAGAGPEDAHPAHNAAADTSRIHRNARKV